MTLTRLINVFLRKAVRTSGSLQLLVAPRSLSRYCDYSRSTFSYFFATLERNRERLSRSFDAEFWLGEKWSVRILRHVDYRVRDIPLDKLDR